MKHSTQKSIPVDFVQRFASGCRFSDGRGQRKRNSFRRNADQEEIPDGADGWLGEYLL